MAVSNRNFIKRLKKQKEDALEYVIDVYMPYVKAITMRILQPIGQRDMVDDCINEVFLEVWKNSHQFNGEVEDFKKWIGVITKYRAIDFYRVYEKQAAREEELDEVESIADNRHNDLLEREKRNELLFELSKLDEVDREIFMMKYYVGLSNGEIAESLQLTKSAVDNRLYRGKKKLARTIQLKEGFTI
ncbi:sigma-70 family RNA polymerase sigma factor [Falsibacillus pallidus]|uniref:RNA polymerase sigma-70 factor (ECF subfamily) n=1 Tax=Falsibacillus pallidus TaxID=493781 RepID=A0A370G015_9BACI|nr:sigma-70 family RNA polymerase sigma factor [Falsibacillus pallidus]RDI37257.1 RNA polymerase sigma-70 factor (ECF subfamily) [Falsibacillus pallidus]